MVRSQVAGLEWIHRNIAAFGGDPGRVTIFGVSAGGDAVAHMSISPRGDGLFHRAIFQSANITHQFVHHKTPFLGYVSAVEAGAGFAARHVGEGAGQLERLRAMPAAELAQRYSDDKAAGEINEQVSDSPG